MRGQAQIAALLMYFSVCNIHYFKPLFLRISNGIGCPAAAFCQIADAYAAVVYQVAVALVHTAPCVLLGGVDNFCRFALFERSTIKLL